jgi:hypothetical protein
MDKSDKTLLPNEHPSTAPTSETFRLRRHLIPGAILTLIGLFVLFFDSQKVYGTIVCYFGVMALILATGHIWIQSIRHQPEVHAAGRRVQSDAVLVACCVVGSGFTALAIVCVATVTVFEGGTATALLWALGSLFSGGFIGFLFAIPSDAEPPKSQVHINTSLNQIADWLTKIIVGVSLVNVRTAYRYFVRAASTLGAGLATREAQHPAALAFAAGLIVTFFSLSFTGTYLLTRLWLSVAIVRADRLAYDIHSTSEHEIPPSTKNPTGSTG